MTSLMRYCGITMLLLPFSVQWAGAAPALDVRLMRLPEGGLQPQVLADGSDNVHLVYLKGDPKACDVMYTRRLPGETNFTLPLRVNSKPGSAIAIGTVRGAQLALGRNGRIHIAWNGSNQASTKPSGDASMFYSRLADHGRTFEPQRDLMTCTTHLDGGGSIAADANGRVYVVWHGHKRVGPQEEIDRGVFVAVSTDDGQTFAPERQVNPPDTGVCGCCGLKTFADRHGSLAILYRSANLAGNRDIVLLLSTNGGTSFVSRVVGQWSVSTCPMSTEALGQSGDDFLGLWETKGQIYSASFLPERLDSISPVPVAGSTGNRKHPAFAVGHTKDSPKLLVWTEGTAWEKGGSLAWECLDARGGPIAHGGADGISVWSFAAALAEPGGSFTVIY